MKVTCTPAQFPCTLSFTIESPEEAASLMMLFDARALVGKTLAEGWHSLFGAGNDKAAMEADITANIEKTFEPLAMHLRG